MFNAYGPTEATIWATCTTPLSPGQPITIGAPIPGVCALVLDARLHPAPIGVVGELYLTGPALAHGYAAQPQLTAQRFVANPFGAPGTRLYRTGDLARWTPQGTLDCLGRADTQIKLRGQRIELGDIENALLACPQVTQAAATVHHTTTGTPHLIGYITLEHTSPASTVVQDAEIVEQWQWMYDELYRAEIQVSELGMDFRGWNSSYTDEPIPVEEMVEWRSALVDRIMALRPRRVLEIGAGSGLVLSQIAPQCEHYVATDMSAVAIDNLARSLKQSQIPWRDRVQLLTRPAHITESLPQGYFDTVILNSVVQYFPNAEYLAGLIDKVVDLLAPGGAVFIGDVRNHTLQGAFHTAVALARTAGAPTIEATEIRQRVRRAMLSERELLLAPEFFTSWAADHPSVAGLDIQVKRGSADNELNRYRYDVIIHKTPTPVRSVAAAPTWEWAACAGLSGLHTRLTSLRPAAVRVTHIPRAGLITDVQLGHAVADGLSLTDALAQATGDTAIPEELHCLGETTGYHVAVTWGAQPGTVDAVFISDPGPLTGLYSPRTGAHQHTTNANDPRTNTKITAVRQWLAARLPDYMVPAQVVVLDEFPLTSSGKIDRKALPAPVFAATPSRPPRTRTEEAVADVFAEVLGLDRVGLDDDFFALGGDSIVSIQVVSACRARGVWLSPRDVFECRTAARLAEVAAAAPAGPALDELPGGGVGDVPLTPIVWDLVNRGGGFDRFVQSVMVQLPVGVDRAGIVETVSAVMARHDMLRARLWRDPSAGWRMQTREMGSVDVDTLLHRIPFAADALPQKLASLASEALDAAVDRLNPSAGSVLRMVWLDPTGVQGVSDRSGRLVIVAHHLVVDAVSWRIIVFDLMRAWEQVAAGRRAVLPPAGTSMRRWAHGLQEAARRGQFDAELAAWAQISDGPDPSMGSRPFDPGVDVMSTVDRVQLRLPHEVFEPVLTTLPALFRSGVHDGLLAALAAAVAVWRSRRGVAESSVLVHLEGHGREEAVVAGADLSQTVGWFTSVFPARLDVSGIDVDDVLRGGAAAGVLIKAIKEQLAAIPQHGIGYGVLRYLTPAGASALPDAGHPQLMFNYLGRIAGTELSAGSSDGAWWVTPDFTALTSTPDADMPVPATIQINAMVLDDEFSAQIAYPATLLAQDDVEELVELWRAVLVGLARHTQLPGAGGRTPSDFLLVSVTQDDLTTWEARYPRLVDVWPLAPLQAGLFFHALLAASSVDAYTVQTVIDIAGEVDTARLHAAAQGIIDRHDNLRTAFVTTSQGTAVQVVLADVEVPWHELDLTGSANAGQDFTRFTQSDRLQQFDLTTPPLLRFTLVAKGHNKFALVITHHHILLDGWSSPMLLQEFLTLYAADGEHSALPPSRPFRDYLEWVALIDTEQSAQAWRHALAGLDEPTMLAAVDPARQIASAPAKHVLEFDDQHSTCIADFAARTGVTLNTVIQLAWAIVLSHLTGRDDVVFGTTVSGRPAELPGVDTMIGLLINTVPTRVRIIPTETVTAALHRLQSEQATLIDHHHRSLADIQRLAGPGAAFDTALAFESYPVNTTALRQLLESLGELHVEGFKVADATHYPLSLAVSFDARLRVEFSYLTEVFDAADVERIAGFYRRLLEAVVADGPVVVGEVSLLDGGERELVVSGFSGAGVAAPVGVVSQVLAAAVAADPDAVAIIDGARQVSYRQLDESSTRLARVLIEAGVGPERAVGVAMDRCAELVVTWWAVVKAGGVYVPVDAAHPVERIAAVLDTVDAVCVLSCAAHSLAGAGARPVLRVDELDLSDRRADPITDAERRSPLSVDNTAYVIFTSGSTGTPKGVAVGHAGLLGMAAAQRELFAVGAQARILMVAAPTFDLSIFEWLWAAGSAAPVVVAPPQVYAGDALTSLLHDQQISAAILTPTVLASLDRTRLGGLSTLIAGAEPCPPELVTAWAPGRRMFNAYGPTEATIWATCTTPLSPGQPITIGAPIPGVCALVLDARLHPAPIGVVGELYLTGPALAHGYAAQPQLTAQRFVANPYGAPGTRLYRTGDLARWTPQGTLDCLGRADTQIKLRGQRIELGDIENALLACPQVTQAAATIHHTTTGTAHLIGYISGSASLDPTAIRQQLSTRLPAYLVPTQVLLLDKIPLTSSGKLNRTALPPPVFAAAQYRPPQTPTENTVADIFADVLGLDRAGLDDDFFALGGDSLLATRLSTRLQLALNTEVPVRSIFDAPTVADLANHLHRNTNTISVQEVVPVQTLKKGAGIPLFCIHPGGGVSWPYQALGNYLDCPIIGIQQILQGEEAEPRSIRDMAKNYADRIQGVYPTGPYNLLGWSFGGVVAHELAIELQRRGCAIARLVLLDADPGIDDIQDLGDWRKQIEVLRFYGIDVPEQDEPLTYEQIEKLIREPGATEFLRYKPLLDLFVQNIASGMALYQTHEPDVFDGDMIIFSAVRDESDRSLSLLQSWRPYVTGDITVHSVNSTHQEMLTTQSLCMYGRQLERTLIRAGSTEVSGLFCTPDQLVGRTKPNVKWSRSGRPTCAAGKHVYEDQHQRVTQSSSEYSQGVS
nr:non-ribosomal peptide synthetase [Mycobacterium gastri]